MTDEEVKKIVSENIKLQRKFENLTQKELAEKSGVGIQTIISIEGCRVWTSDSNLCKIADALNIAFYELFLPTKEEDIKEKIMKKVKRIIQETYAECMAENVVDYFTKDKEQE